MILQIECRAIADAIEMTAQNSFDHRIVNALRNAADRIDALEKGAGHRAVTPKTETSVLVGQRVAGGAR